MSVPAWRPVRWLLPAVGALIAALLLVDGSAHADDADLQRLERELEEVREERAQIESRIEEATRSYERLVERIATLEAEAEELEQQVAALREELGVLDEQVTDRLRAVFKYGSNVDPLSVFLSSDDPNAALARAESIQRAVLADQVSSEELTAARTRLAVSEDQLAERQDELEVAVEEQQETTATLQEAFAELGETAESLEGEAEAERQRLEELRLEREREERERQERLEAERRAQEEAAAAQSSSDDSSSDSGSGGGSTQEASASEEPASEPAPTSGGGMACPLDQPRSFIDSWGHARSGGRAHRGTDLMGPKGIPVRAIADGVWNIQSPGPSAGLWAILRADNGDHYWYLHLDSHTVSNGARVTAGQQVGTNGSTGNAVAGAEHVHFEQHVGGGRAINPYPLLRSVCG